MMKKFSMSVLGIMVFDVLLLCGCGADVKAPSKPLGIAAVPQSKETQTVKNRHFRFAVTDWCQRLFGAKHDTAGLCGLATALDADLDLVAHDQWSQVQATKVRLSCVLPDMGVEGPESKPVAPFVPGFNNPETAERTYAAIDTALDRAAKAGIKYILVFTGFDTKEDRAIQCQRIVEGYTVIRGSAQESLIKKAERLGITFVIEMLNTEGEEATWKGHPGYLGNNTAEIVANVIRPIGSKNFLLVFDVYHVRMMGEDLIEMIEKYHDVIGYVHVAGVVVQVGGGHHPKNRGELDVNGQLVDYAEVCAKLAEYLPQGTYVLLEYIPTETDPTKVQQGLADAITICESKIPKGK